MGYKVVVEGGYLRFGAAHFITMGGKCERLHGHNYDVSASVEGPLGADSYVIDFVLLKHTLRDICEVLDHRFLLPLQNEHLTMQECNGHWEIQFGDRHYVFPSRDVQPLPVDNVTAERLAEYIWGRLAAEIQAEGREHGQSITLSVGVAEAPGQTAWLSQEI
jgi:6-pyruvoyl tetrahydropterin synthase/QueD family protein